MKLHDLLLEQNEPEQVVQTILRDCQPFLKEVNYEQSKVYGLYRGTRTNNNNQLLTIRKPRPNRKAMDMPPLIHQHIDQWFKENMGHYYRSQSTFAIGNNLTASHYGNVHSVFPIGQFDYVWSRRCADLFSCIRSSFIRQTSQDEWKEIASKTRGELDFHQEERLNDILDELDFVKNVDLGTAIFKYYEIMINTNSYYLLNHNAPHFMKVVGQLSKHLN